LLPLFWDMGNLFFVRASGFGLRASAKLVLFYSPFIFRGTPCPLGEHGAADKAFTTEDTEEHRVNLVRSAFCVLLEHLFGVDGDEDAAAAGQDFVVFIQDFGGVDVFRSAHFDFAAFHAQGFVQRHWLQILDCHFACEGDYVMQLVYFSHGVVEDASDNAAVAVAWRSGVAFAEAEAADEGLAGFVEDEFQAHTLEIVLAADEAVVLLHFVVAGVVVLGFGGHGDDFNLCDSLAAFSKALPPRGKNAGCGRNALQV
jgi:hypothetical protein